MLRQRGSTAPLRTRSVCGAGTTPTRIGRTLCAHFVVWAHNTTLHSAIQQVMPYDALIGQSRRVGVISFKISPELAESLTTEVLLNATLGLSEDSELDPSCIAEEPQTSCSIRFTECHAPMLVAPFQAMVYIFRYFDLRKKCGALMQDLEGVDYDAADEAAPREALLLFEPHPDLPWNPNTISVPCKALKDGEECKNRHLIPTSGVMRGH